MLIAHQTGVWPHGSYSSSTKLLFRMFSRRPNPQGTDFSHGSAKLLPRLRVEGDSPGNSTNSIHFTNHPRLRLMNRIGFKMYEGQGARSGQEPPPSRFTRSNDEFTLETDSRKIRPSGIS